MSEAHRIFVQRDYASYGEHYAVYVNKYGNIDKPSEVYSMHISDDGWSPHEECATYDPSFHMSADEARSLMDSLWAAGVRPSGDGTSGQLAATQNHLADIKALLWHREGIDV